MFYQEKGTANVHQSQNSVKTVLGYNFSSDLGQEGGQPLISCLQLAGHKEQTVFANDATIDNGVQLHNN